MIIWYYRDLEFLILDRHVPTVLLRMQFIIQHICSVHLQCKLNSFNVRIEFTEECSSKISNILKVMITHLTKINVCQSNGINNKIMAYKNPSGMKIIVSVLNKCVEL